MKAKKKKRILIGGIIFAIVVVSIANYLIRHYKILRPEIEVITLNEHVYLMNDNNESTGYIVVGQDKAAVIDTMYGYKNVEKVVKKITNLPIVVINTHGHIDHVAGDIYFKEAYIHPDDLNLAMETVGNNFSFEMMKEGDVFDLGGIKLEVYECPGHTKGSVCLLDREDKMLFTGDTINRHCWMQLPESTDLESFYEALTRLEKLDGSYDMVLCGHTQTGDPASLFEEHKAAVKEVIDGVGSKEDEDYTYFGGVCKIHKYTEGNVGIIYNKKS